MKPVDVSDVEMSFPATVDHLLPAWQTLPAEFQRAHSPWCALASHWFFSGLSRGEAAKLVPVDGIDKRLAFRHTQACLGSFQPKHEHKIAGVGWLMSQWFQKPSGVVAGVDFGVAR